MPPLYLLCFYSVFSLKSVCHVCNEAKCFAATLSKRQRDSQLENISIVNLSNKTSNKTLLNEKSPTKVSLSEHVISLSDKACVSNLD